MISLILSLVACGMHIHAYVIDDSEPVRLPCSAPNSIENYLTVLSACTWALFCGRFAQSISSCGMKTRALKESITTKKETSTTCWDCVKVCGSGPSLVLLSYLRYLVVNSNPEAEQSQDVRVLAAFVWMNTSWACCYMGSTPAKAAERLLRSCPTWLTGCGILSRWHCYKPLLACRVCELRVVHLLLLLVSQGVYVVTPPPPQTASQITSCTCHRCAGTVQATTAGVARRARMQATVALWCLSAMASKEASVAGMWLRCAQPGQQLRACSKERLLDGMAQHRVLCSQHCCSMH